MNTGVPGIKGVASYLRLAVPRRLAAERQRISDFLGINFPLLVNQLLGAGLSINNLNNITAYARTFRDAGLYVKLLAAGRREVFLPSSNVLSVTYALSHTRLLHEAPAIENFLKKIAETFKKEGKTIPVGELDLAAARKQYEDASTGLEPQERRELDAAYVMAAVKDNIKLASHEAMADNYEAMFRLLDGVTVNSLDKAARSIVDTAQRLWPGGNPTLMLYREDGGRRFLVPVAVALNESIIRQGEKVLGKKLGQYEIPLDSSSWNPYVKYFTHGEMVVDRNLTRETFKIVCEGFIHHQFKGGILRRLFFGISFPGGDNSLVFVPLNVTDPLTQRERKIGIMAILKKDFFTQDQLRQVEIFARSSARTLATIEWINELVRARSEADAFAHERAVYAGKIEHTLAELKRTQDTLVKKERMAAAGELAADVSHEIKNSNRTAGALVDKIVRLGAQLDVLHQILETKSVLGFWSENDLARLSRMERERDKLTRALVGVLNENDRIVRGMLSFAKEEGSARDNVPLSRFISEKEVGFRAQAEKEGIQFFVTTKMEKNDGVNISDLDLSDILRNLIGNAIDALRRSGKKEKVIWLTAVRKPGNPEEIVLKIADSGPGFKAQDLKDIFSDARRGQSKQGTGLGLPEVRKKVERNNGTIAVSSQEGAGTTFEIKFPWVEASLAKASGEKKPVIPHAVAEKIEVLFADDNVENRELTHESLREMGFPVSSYTNTRDAFDAITKGMAFPDLVMVDQDFGKDDMRGHELILKVAEFYRRERRKLPRFAIFSGDLPPTHGAVAKVVREYGVKWIAKGADAEEFRGEVSEAAVGEVKNVRSFFPSTYLKDNAYRVFGKGMCHKMNNCLQVLGYVQFEDPDVAMARKGYARYFDSFEKLVSLARSVKNFSGRSIAEIAADGEFSANEILKDRDVIRGWDALAPEQRYKIAIVILKYHALASGPLKRIMDLLGRRKLSRADIAEIAELQEEVKEINGAFGLRTQAGKEMARFYTLLEEI